MASIPLSVLIPDSNEPLRQALGAQQIQGQQQAMALRNALAPGQLQQQQQELQQGQLANTATSQENQIRQIGLNNQAITQKALTDPNFSKHLEETSGSDQSCTPGTGTATVPLHPIAQVLSKYYGLPMLGPGGAIEVSNTFTKAAQEGATLAKTQGDAAADALKQHSDKLENFANLAVPILTKASSPNADQQQISQDLAGLQSTIKANPNLYPPEALQHVGELGTIQGLQGATNIAKIHGMVIDETTKQAGLVHSQQESDPVYQLSKPEMLANPGAQQAIQAKINDPATDPKDVPRLQALLPRAELAQQNTLAQKKREELNQQAITQGDPNAAGQLLANRSLTLQELKTRGATPQFITRAVQAAQQFDPAFKAAESEAQSKIAASPTNQQFFGNTDSLLVKGGTLDQLEQAGQALGNSKIPAYNSLANWTKAALGSGPQAAYAAKVLGVADDYAKVMGGGVGSDTGRQQAVDIISKNLSPEGRSQGIQAIRETVASQREGRIGTNPYMRDMYPDPSGGGAKEPPAHNLAKPAKGVTRIQASDGSVHDIPTQNLFKARQRDPRLQVVQ